MIMIIMNTLFFSSATWKHISLDERQKLTANKSEDGEFWMSFDDFKKHFTDLEMCSVSIDELYEDEAGE